LKYLIVIIILVIVFLISGFVIIGAQFEPEQDKKVVTEMSPKDLHKMLGEMKARKLLREREAMKLVDTKMPAAQDDYDALYYGLNLTIDDTNETVSGWVDMEAESKIDGLTLVTLNLIDSLTVDSVKLGGSSLAFVHSNNLIDVTMDRAYNTGEKFVVSVFYHGHPEPGGFQAFTFETYNGYQMISSLSEPFFARNWWPCKDFPHDKADSADINITVRPDLIVASNGTLRDTVTNPEGTKTYKWHESYPITTYLISVTIYAYSEFTYYYHYSPTDSMDVVFYVFPDYQGTAQAHYLVTVPAIEYYAQAFGEYPFLSEKYGMAHFKWGGGMEHQTCTSIIYWYYVWSLTVHELAHQWWGDYITCRDWQHIWLNEGFASYCEALFREHYYGEAAYHEHMGYMEWLDGGTVYVEDTSDVWAIFDLIVYDKGAWVLHMLRHVVGDSTFFDILKAYYSDPRYANGTAVTEDFHGVCEDVYGDDLDWFFQEWIYGEYHPSYQYSWASDTSFEGYEVYLHIDQMQPSEPQVYTMPIDITIRDTTSAVETTLVVFNDMRSQDLKLTVDVLPQKLELDTDDWILKVSTEEDYELNIVTSSLTDGKTFWTYYDTIKAKGGTSPYEWSVISGDFPDGLSLSSSSGIISGAPFVADTFYFTVQVEDADNITDTQDFTMVVEYDTTAQCDLIYDDKVNLADVVFLANYLFKSGPAPNPLECGDVDCNDSTEVADIIYLANYLLKGGSDPCW